jgi:hypothetical protein
LPVSANNGHARTAGADFGRTLAESAVFGNGRIRARLNERVNGRIDKKFTPSYLSGTVQAIIALHMCLCIIASRKPEYRRISSKPHLMPIARTIQYDRDRLPSICGTDGVNTSARPESGRIMMR